ncbi:MAG TPA: LapA family protein [Streptosporangiaceae bacterium]|nr:LapA family protein [Streptosporangiaceae bacterium]
MASPDQVPATATTDPATTAPPSTPAGPRQAPVHHVIRPSRLGGAWVAVALFAVVLLLLLVFILENSQQVNIGYFGAHGHLPLGVALLLAAVLGILLVVIPGAGRMMQLRRTARRHRRADAAAAQPAEPQPAEPQPAATQPAATPDAPAPAGSPPDGMTRT